jgi:hypothetical protein
MRRIAAREPLIKSSPRRRGSSKFPSNLVCRLRGNDKTVLKQSFTRPSQHRLRQRGQALLILLVILGIGFGAWFYTFAGPAGSTVERDKITAAALAQAKTALIGYAAGVSDLAGGERPGDLPCPDTNDSGFTGSSCGNAAGTTGQTLRIGRLPWKSLGLPDLRDGDGERLWYAVSKNFKYNTRTACAAPGDAGCLNSDARGTITVRNTAGNVIYDGSNPDPFTPSGVIAVIFAPGKVLQRLGSGTAQVRDCSGAGCAVTGFCNSTATAKCDPVNYLDTNGTEDNADFDESGNTNGFINGVIRDAGGNAIVNDRLLVITYEDLMPVVQRRVAKEVLNCLSTYASVPQNNGRYPWAAPISDVTPPYVDVVNTRFGRVPDTDTASSTFLAATFRGLGGAVSTLVCTNVLSPSALCMARDWPVSCGIKQGSWWTNWKEMVFYGLAQPYQPADPVSALLGVAAPGGCGGACPGPNCCLLVDPPAPSADKRVVVVVAGKRLSATAYPTGNGQPRTVGFKSDATNYLEGTNDNTATSYTYEQQPISASFSDFLLYQ